MRKFRWVLIWGLLFSFLMAEEYRTIIRPSGVDTQNFKRVALVIGNDSYEVAPLSNAVDDASAMKTFLEAEGFKVIYVNNANEQTMKSKVAEFLALLNSKSIGFVYYSGHGIQEYSQNERRTVNYLIPTNNAQFRSLTDLDYHALSLNYVLDSLSEKKNGLNIVLLDACRTPFKAFSKSPQVGLAPSNAQGVYIAYATASGDKALDNSLFRKSFIKYAKESLRLVDIFEKVKTDVYGQTNQIPFISNGKIGSFYFVEPVEKKVVVIPSIVTPTPIVNAPVPIKIVSNQVSELDSCKKISRINSWNTFAGGGVITSYILKNKMSLTQYVTQCNNGISEYCNSLGSAYSRGNIIKKDKEKSLAFYTKGCTLNNKDACYSKAIILKDKLMIKELCDEGKTEACIFLGILSSGQEKVSIFKNACQLDNKRGCSNLAYLYKNGLEGLPKNCSKALSLYQKSCELGNEKICKKLEKTKSSNW